MKYVTFVHDFKFYLENNRVYTAVGMPIDYFDRIFDADRGVDFVNIISRTENRCISNIPQGFVSFPSNVVASKFKYSSYLSLLNFFGWPSLIWDLKRSSMIVLSIPSVSGIFVGMLCNVFKIKYSVEVAADVDMFNSKPGGKLFTFFIKFAMPFIIKKAIGAAYVSEYLSKKFPVNNNNVLVASNVNIRVPKENTWLSHYSSAFFNSDKVTMVFAGGLNSRKGIDLILEAIVLLNERNKARKFNVLLAGGNADRDWVSYVKKKNIESYVTFLGVVSKDELHNIISNSHLYLQPSLSEGIPRATLEAMSLGIPVVASDLPGFKEILDIKYLFETGRVSDFVYKIEHLISSEKEMFSASKRNHLISFKFDFENLHKKRIRFYKGVLGVLND